MCFLGHIALAPVCPFCAFLGTKTTRLFTIKILREEVEMNVIIAIKYVGDPESG
jgi:hypothetical protein